MIGLSTLHSKLNKGLNQAFTSSSYKFIKANAGGKLPDDIYITTQFTIPYSQANNMHGIITRQAIDGDSTQIQLTRSEQPELSVSFNCYADTETDCMQVAEQVKDWLLFANKQYLESCGMVVVGVGNIQDRTVWLEVSFKYQYGFDATIRVEDKITVNVDTIQSGQIDDDSNAIEIDF